MRDNRIEVRLERIEAHLERIQETLAGIGRVLWGPSGNPYTEASLELAKEAAEQFRKKRDEAIERHRQERIGAGRDPHGWDADDEFASQMG